MKQLDGPRILIIDIETLPIEAYVWGIYDQSPGVSMMKRDWTLLSYAAKWLGEKKIYYADVRGQKDIRNDFKLAVGARALLDKADIVIWQNGDAFDGKKLNARFLMNKLMPPSPYRTIDTKKLAKKTFGFTSNSLEYLADKLNVKYKKLKHKKFPGFELWKECLARNPAAFREMEKYNKHDILATEEVYEKLQAWHQPIDFNVYRAGKITNRCNCGSSNFKRDGWAYTNNGKFQRYQCLKCGARTQDRGQANNALTKEKRSGLKRRVT
jgi:hypothetical protein